LHIIKIQLLQQLILKQIFGIPNVVFLLTCTLLFGCGKMVGSDNPFTITSSTQLLPLSEALASEFQVHNKKPISVKGSLGRETELLEQNLSDLVITNQGLTGEQGNNRFTEKIIAYDKTVVICHLRTKVTNLSQSDLLKIFQGKIINWSQLGGPNIPIQILSRETGSAIRLSFDKQFLGSTNGTRSDTSLNALIVNSNPEMRSAVANIPGSIGYLSVGALNSSVQELKIINLHGATVESPLLKIYLIYKTNNTKPELKDFADFLMSVRAESIIKDEGYLLPDKLSHSPFVSRSSSF
jgi:phosphate transport system substrate-binding protein